MSVFERVAGADAVFFVVPLLGALSGPRSCWVVEWQAIEPEEAVTYRNRFGDLSPLARLELSLIAEQPDAHVRIFGLAGQPAPRAPAAIPDRLAP